MREGSDARSPQLQRYSGAWIGERRRWVHWRQRFHRSRSHRAALRPKASFFSRTGGSRTIRVFPCSSTRAQSRSPATAIPLPCSKPFSGGTDGLRSGGTASMTFITTIRPRTRRWDLPAAEHASCSAVRTGARLIVEAGDVAVLPAGTGHCLIEASDDFLVVGAYPPHQRWDICRQAPTPAATERMERLPFPAADPVSGDGGAREAVGAGPVDAIADRVCRAPKPVERRASFRRGERSPVDLMAVTHCRRPALRGNRHEAARPR